MKNRVGEIHTTNQNFEIKIIEYFKNDNCTIEFKDGGIRYNIQYSQIKAKNVKNPNHKTICGVGFFGYGNYKSKKNKAYKTWQDMILRCYDTNIQNKQSSYKGCSVHLDWHNFQNFAEWYSDNYIQGWFLDKDIIIKGNKVYSAETCCFVPREINNIFTSSKITRGELPIGISFNQNKYMVSMSYNNKLKNLGRYKNIDEAFLVYKNAKECKIKEITNKWKSKISERVYDSLTNYIIDIND